MILKVQLTIKFRWLRIDIYKTDQLFDVPIPLPPVPFHISHILFNERGVYLKVWNEEPA